jgi:DNA-directed RNA polymerase subunit RPC12/RpoP
MDVTKRYPVQYRCEHCGNSGFTRKDGPRCPTCQFGALVPMIWTGLRWA